MRSKEILKATLVLPTVNDREPSIDLCLPQKFRGMEMYGVCDTRVLLMSEVEPVTPGNGNPVCTTCKLKQGGGIGWLGLGCTGPQESYQDVKGDFVSSAIITVYEHAPKGMTVTNCGVVIDVFEYGEAQLGLLEE